MLTPPMTTAKLSRVLRSRATFRLASTMTIKPIRATNMRPKARKEPMAGLWASASPLVAMRLMVPTRPMPVEARSMAIAPSFLFMT